MMMVINEHIYLYENSAAFVWSFEMIWVEKWRSNLLIHMKAKKLGLRLSTGESQRCGNSDGLNPLLTSEGQSNDIRSDSLQT